MGEQVPVIQEIHMASGVESANAICSGASPTTVFTTRGSVGNKSLLPRLKEGSNATVRGVNGPSSVVGICCCDATRTNPNAKQEKNQSAIAPLPNLPIALNYDLITHSQWYACFSHPHRNMVRSTHATFALHLFLKHTMGSSPAYSRTMSC